MKTAHLIRQVALASLLSMPVHAGDPGGRDASSALTAEEAAPGATLSAGYMTHYVFYGVDLGEHAVWTGLDLTLPTPVPVDVGLWYVNPTDGQFDDELDLYASVTREVAGFETTLTASGYFYPEAGEGHSGELGLAAGHSLGFVDWNATANYDFIIGGWYFETGLTKGVSLSDSAELVLSGGIAYQHGYNASASAWNHAFAMIALPVSLRENVVIEPYIAGLLALDAVEEFQDDLIHAGISLNVSF